jgi:hypothetical protein
MNVWTCATLITLAGALGGVVNALITDNGFVLPRIRHAVWCAGFLSNIIVGAFAAFSSWAFYGSGAGIDLASAVERNQISLRFSAVAGAFLVGVIGARWITNEVDKQLLKDSVKVAGSKKKLTAKKSEELVKGSALEVRERVEAA